MEKRTTCAECPWRVKSGHNRRMIDSILRWFKSGTRKEVTHRCHMISQDLFSPTDSCNVCVGSQEAQTKIEINGNFK
jgi:hypothetical protein